MDSILINKSKFQISELARDRIVIAIRWLCMALFIYTAYAKIVDHERFLNGLKNVSIISGSAVVISFLVPIIEIIIAILLLIPVTAKQGLYSFIAAMSFFTGYIISALIWEKNLPCHCGGAIERLSWTQHIWFNLIFVLFAVFALWLVSVNTSLKKTANEKF